MKELVNAMNQTKGAIEMKTATVGYSIFKVNDDYIVAETQEQAVKHHMDAVGTNWYPEGEELEIEVIPHEREGRFETETGWEDKTFGEWLADFEYTGPQLLCWNE
jgi:hypothetical protein